MTQRRLTIAIDCDDVLVPTARHIIDDYNERFGTQVGFEHFYDMTDATLDVWGVESREEAVKRVADFLYSDKHSKIKPDSEAILAIKKLAVEHELHLVSGRIDALKPVTEQMLKKYFPNCFRTVEHTNFIAQKETKLVSRSKGDICRVIGADILIDDHPHHAESALAANVSKVILFGEYAWNRLDVMPQRVVHCKDWSRAVEEVNVHAAR
jgi:5'(3')-deoxyribonucleotidase